jgi:hypothetical protein
MKDDYSRKVIMSSENPLQRVNYFYGQLLSANDFQSEQDYWLSKERRHNRFLHGWGTVCGLEVSTNGLSEVVVQPGLAIDCAGNEIYVDAPVKMTIPQAGRVQFVVLQYQEAKAFPVPAISAETDTPEEEMAFSRIVEGFQLNIFDHDPTTRHGCKRPGMPGCGGLHPICIARLRKGPKRWRIEQRGRPRGRRR